MNALVFERPAPDTSGTSVARVPVPVPGPGEVAIQVRYAGINFKDIMARRGDARYVPSWPFVPGVEVSGHVSAVGPDVTGWALGDPVVALTNAGGLAEVAVARAELVAPVPNDLSLSQAAAVPGAPTTAVLLVDEIARVRSGDVLLVHSAAGAVGRSVAEVARQRGVKTLIGTVGAASRAAGAQSAGYDTVIVRGPDLAATVQTKVDVVLDPQGTDCLEDDLAVLVPGGRIVLFGNAGGNPLEDVPTGRLFGGNASVGGFSLEALSVNRPEVVVRAMTEAMNLMLKGDLTLPVTEVDGLREAATAQQALATGTGEAKYVVRV